MSPSEQTPSWRIRGRTGARQLKSLSLRAPHCSLGQHAAHTGTPAGTGVLTFRVRVRPTGEEGAGQWSLWGKGPESPACPIQSPGSSQPRTRPPGEAEGHLPPESEASTLSLWLLAHRSCPYTGLWGSGKRPGGLPQARGLDSGADKRLAQSSHRWALLSAGTGGPCLLFGHRCPNTLVCS